MTGLALRTHRENLKPSVIALVPEAAPYPAPA